MKIGIFTISDSCSKDPNLDISGPRLVKLLKNSDKLKSVEVTKELIIPDDFDQIQRALKEFSKECDFILTTGGTGLSVRDVTPEATKSVIERECVGIVTAILIKGLQQTPMAALSRLTAGTLGSCLIVNLPGSVKAVEEGFSVLEEIIPHAISVLKNKSVEVEETHRANK